MKNFELFMKTYEVCLRRAVEGFPDEYAFQVTEVPDVVERMSRAFLHGTYNKDGRAVKWTCMELNIKCTYKAINAFLADMSPRVEDAIDRTVAGIQEEDNA